MTTVIKVENLSKQYRLGNVGTGSIAHDLNRTWHRVRGKEDPYLKIGEENDRSIKGNSDYVWALKDINFEVKQGEVLGIIGRNGAGKSTLLKILSRTTTPTTGQIKIKGRVASLLEVGTGFHPELSGRENIFLNGAILGMSKQEIKTKFDEIVDFAGVERYIDTPVKRYSSGMYVRLAFGVAAHLEPEILIVDEVLAVGDAEFQKKALGKMKDVSTKDGRTVLFVSHNLQAVRNLCPCSIILDKGKLTHLGNTVNLTELYLRRDSNLNQAYTRNNLTIQSLTFSSERIISNNPVSINVKVLSSLDDVLDSIGLLIYNQNQQRVAIIDLRSPDGNYKLKANQFLCFNVRLKQIPLVEGTYQIGMFIGGNYVYENLMDIISINIYNPPTLIMSYPSEVRGTVNLEQTFTYAIS